MRWNPRRRCRLLTPLACAPQSVVLHEMTLASQKSTFPTAVGLRVTGVDDSTYSITGDAYSAITMPGTDTHNARILQKDDTSLGE